MIVYATGYLGDRTLKTSTSKVKAFDEMVKRRNFLVCDIRLNPYSLAACWRKASFEERLGDSYTCIPELGNINYKNGKQIHIAEPEKGVSLLLERSRQSGKTPLILCGCEDFESCHRLTVAQLLGRLPEIENVIEVFIWDGEVLSPNPAHTPSSP